MKGKQLLQGVSASVMVLAAAQPALATEGGKIDVFTGNLISASASLAIRIDMNAAAAQTTTTAPGVQTSNTDSDTSESKDITVTGTRLKASDSVIPVKPLDREEIIESGQMDLAEALRDVPGVSGNDSLTNNQGSIQGNGLSTIALRGLGLARTLVLIDGKRTVSNAGNRNVVSLSSVPEYMIRRVDVTTGGASAVYGSDAIAGVVNIITESRLDGFRARVVGRDTDSGGGGSMEYSAGAGTRILDGRLYLMGAVTYSKQDALLARDRDWAMISSSYSAVTNTLTTPNLSSSPPGGRYAGNGFYYDQNGLQRNFVTNTHGYDTRDEGFLITPREMLNAGVKFTFDVNNDLRFYGTGMYSAVDTNMQFAPVTSAYNETYGVNGEFEVGRIARFNPYAPAAISAAVANTGITWFRRFNELGNREFDNRRVTWRGSLGVSGTLGGGAWEWDVNFGHGRFDGHQVSTNYLNLVNLRNALNATTVGGVIVCADAAARAAGCVPLNPFGLTTVTPEAADYIRSDKQFWARNRQYTFEAGITGSPFSLPAGPVQTAFGLEWRLDRTSSRTDDLTQLGISSGPFIPNFDGKITTRAAYAEVRVPLLRNVPLVNQFDVELAGRISDYPELDKVGATLSYRAGLKWTLVKGVQFRAAYGLAQRAPYTTELFSPPRDGYSTVVDVCHDITTATTGAVAAGCRLDPRIAAVIARDGRFRQDSTYVFTPASGNLNLKEEEAHTFTAGFVLSPWKGFEASVDYYDIKISDAIGAIDTPSLMRECYSDPSGLGNKFCAPIQRDAEGQIIRIDNQQQNLNRMRASGFDVAFRQRFGLQQLGIPGRFTLNGSYAHRIKLATTFEGATGLTTTNFNGEVGTFRDEARASLAWASNPVRIRWTAVYMSKAVDSNARKDLFASTGITNPLFLNVPSFLRNDLNITVFPINVSGAKLRVFGNVLNIFNRYGPYLPSGTASGGVHNYNSAYGVSGRTFSLGVEVRL